MGFSTSCGGDFVVEGPGFRPIGPDPEPGWDVRGAMTPPVTSSGCLQPRPAWAGGFSGMGRGSVWGRRSGSVRFRKRSSGSGRLSASGAGSGSGTGPTGSSAGCIPSRSPATRSGRCSTRSGPGSRSAAAGSGSRVRNGIRQFAACCRWYPRPPARAAVRGPFWSCWAKLRGCSGSSACRGTGTPKSGWFGSGLRMWSGPAGRVLPGGSTCGCR